MKLIFVIFIVALLNLAESGFAQGFVNLDFEHPILPLAPLFNEVSASNAIPGWTAYLNGTPQGTIGYDTLSLAGAAIFLEDTNANSVGPAPLQGSYSVLLEGANSIYNPPSQQYSASIGQTGTIPNSAKTLTFWGNIPGGIQITFDGHSLSFIDISNTLNYAIWSADISAYAGQTGQLLFTAPGGLINTSGGVVDSIQFSSQPIPEPSEFALATLGAFCLGFCHRRR